MRRIETVGELRALPAESEIRVNGEVKWVFDYVNLTAAGIPLLEALLLFGHKIEVEVSA
jgi:hypothetical protein